MCECGHCRTNEETANPKGNKRAEDTWKNEGGGEGRSERTSERQEVAKVVVKMPSPCNGGGFIRRMHKQALL